MLLVQSGAPFVLDSKHNLADGDKFLGQFLEKKRDVINTLYFSALVQGTMKH